MTGARPVIALGGPRAPVWHASLPGVLADRIAVGDPAARLWVVDASAPLPLVPPGTWVVLFGTMDEHVLRTARAGLGHHVSVVLRTDLDWLPSFVDALDAGAAPWEALASVQGTLDSGEPLLAAMAPPPTSPAPPSPPPPPPSPPPLPPEPPTEPPAEQRRTRSIRRPAVRHLVTEFWVGQERRRTVLPPASEVVLEVRIAVPRPGDVSGREAVDVPREEGRDSVLLDVVASGTPWDAPQTQQISVPTADPTASSTSAAFTLTTPASGGVVDVQLMVLYRGRPLQVASLAAAVRATALPSDAVRLLVRATTSGPLPVLAPHSPTVTPAPADAAPAVSPLSDAPAESRPEYFTLDADGAELVRTQTGARVPLDDVDELLKALEHTLSQVLGSSDAPEGLGDPRARELLVGLARQGAQLRERLDPLRLGAADEISLVVHPHTDLFPLELVYDGPVPRARARVCPGHGPAATKPCTGPSVLVVCPLAFWGMSRAICRTFLREADEVEPPPPPPRLSLSSILYAAAHRADAGSPKDARPTELLLQAARASARGEFTAVTSWTGWRRAVAASHPTLMLVLAHTEEVPREFLLEIGQDSRLSSADLTPDHLSTDPRVRPLVVLIACATAVASNPFGSFHGAITARGAAAVVGTLGKLNGPQGARAAAAVLTSLQEASSDQVRRLGEVLMDARRDLIAQGLLVGLLLASHGEINTVVEA